MPDKEYGCRGIAAGAAGGELLISADDICFYMCDPKTGRIIEDGHSLNGVLCRLDADKGTVALSEGHAGPYLQLCYNIGSLSVNRACCWRRGW